MRFRTSRMRRVAHVGTVGVLALAAGLVPGTGSASDTHVVEADLTYSCGFSAGPQPVAVRVTAGLPVTSSAGSVIQPEEVSVSLTLPRAPLAEFLGTGSKQVSGVTQLVTEVTQRGESTEVSWQGLRIAETTVGAQDDLSVRATGAVPTITPRSSGDIAFTVGQLDLELTTEATGDDTATPSVLPVSCKPAADQPVELGTVGVPSGAVDTPPGSEAPQVPVPGIVSPGRPEAAAAGDDEIVPGKVQPPEGCYFPKGQEPVPLPPPNGSRPGSGYMAGYSNAEKLNGAMLFKDPGYLVLRLNYMMGINLVCPDDSATWLMTDGKVDYNGKPQMPPTEATFLTFGFMPTTAKVELSLDGKIDIATISWRKRTPDNRFRETTTAAADMWVRLYDVKVNGEPLEVGPQCRSARPMRLVLKGDGVTGRQLPPSGYTVNDGGPLTGYAEIPPFSGCGVTEDLDSLFTASVSGKGNYVKMTQAPLCVEGNPKSICPPLKPTPER
ncbi:DUF6801 domain-containing protein [Streptomyces sp. NPDC058239]|uniref:DUF6801 domain-containing protein n=1 Tax=Streptomyces sp. NPDC058239 TaxID=3346395 RepID=UPI0036E35111